MCIGYRVRFPAVDQKSYFLAQFAAVDEYEGGTIARNTAFDGVYDWIPNFLFCHRDPVSPDKGVRRQINFDPIDWALSGGEDYTLLCTISPEEAEPIAKNFQKQFKRPLFRLGEITAARGMKIDYPDGSSSPIVPTGWDHFRDKGGD